MKADVKTLDEMVKAKHPTPGGWETSREARKQTWPVRKKTKIVTAHRRKALSRGKTWSGSSVAERRQMLTKVGVTVHGSLVNKEFNKLPDDVQQRLNLHVVQERLFEERVSAHRKKALADKERTAHFVKEGKFPMGTLPDFKGPLVDPSNPERDAKWRKWAEKHGYTETDTGWESKTQKLKFQALEGKTKFEAQNKLSAPGSYFENKPSNISMGEERFMRDGHIVRLKPGVDIEAYKARHPTAKQLTPAEFKKERRKILTKIRSSTKDQIMRDIGLVKVRGAVSGKTYWE